MKELEAKTGNKQYHALKKDKTVKNDTQEKGMCQITEKDLNSQRNAIMQTNNNILGTQ